jgi:hypothetical protein
MFVRAATVQHAASAPEIFLDILTVNLPEAWVFESQAAAFVQCAHARIGRRMWACTMMQNVEEIGRSDRNGLCVFGKF